MKNHEIKDLTGRLYVGLDAAKIDSEKLDKAQEELKPGISYERIIDELDIDAKYKNILHSVTKSVIMIGNKIYEIGKMIINMVVEIYRKYPNTSTGVIVGFVLGFLIFQIPILGWLIGPFVMPTLMAIGGSVGFMQDNLEKLIGRERTHKIEKSILDTTLALAVKG